MFWNEKGDKYAIKVTIICTFYEFIFDDYDSLNSIVDRIERFTEYIVTNTDVIIENLFRYKKGEKRYDYDEQSEMRSISQNKFFIHWEYLIRQKSILSSRNLPDIFAIFHHNLHVLPCFSKFIFIRDYPAVCLFIYLHNCFLKPFCSYNQIWPFQWNKL